MLLRFLADYADDPELRNRFARHPTEVLDEHRVSLEERELFNPLDLRKIEERMIEEVRDVLRRIVLLREDWQGIERIYGPWKPLPMSIAPAGGGTEEEIPFTVFGLQFNVGATVSFTIPDSIAPFPASNVSVDRFGMVLQGTINLPSPGVYDVVINNGGDTGLSFIGTLPGSFVVTESETDSTRR